MGRSKGDTGTSSLGRKRTGPIQRGLRGVGGGTSEGTEGALPKRVSQLHGYLCLGRNQLGDRVGRSRETYPGILPTFVPILLKCRRGTSEIHSGGSIVGSPTYEETVSTPRFVSPGTSTSVEGDRGGGGVVS